MPYTVSSGIIRGSQGRCVWWVRRLLPESRVGLRRGPVRVMERAPDRPVPNVHQVAVPSDILILVSCFQGPV